MTRERFVLAGLARARAPWFRSVAGWATSASIPAEFVKCVSAEELRAMLDGPRRFSAVLLDGGLPATDRDLLASVREDGAAPIVIDAPGVARDWSELGAAAVLPATFERDALLDVLSTYATMVPIGDTSPTEPAAADPIALPHAPVVAVCGPGGTGTSTVAMALAEGLAATHDGTVLLADLRRHAEQGMLHDARDVAPSVQELVEAHRGRRPAAAEVLEHTFFVEERGYHLLLGLRRARYWAVLRPRVFEAAFSSLQRVFDTVVADVDADLEGEADGGSLDVEERNVMARTVAGRCAVAFVVGRCDAKGVHALVRVIADLRDAGVPTDRVVPVLNVAPRSPRQRAALARAVGELVDGACASAPVFLPARRVAEALRDGVGVPAPIPVTLARACRSLLMRAQTPVVAAVPERVIPGSLGAWSAPLEHEVT